MTADDEPPASKRCSHPDHAGPNPLPLTEFHKRGSSSDGLRNECRACISEHNRRYRKANRENLIEYDRQYRKDNRDAILETSRAWCEANPEKRRETWRRWREANRETEREAERQRKIRRRRANREKALTHYSPYSPPQCACPGCSATEQLTVDHIDGEGTAHRLEIFGRAGIRMAGHHFYAWLVEQEFPPGYQILCQPCNSSKGTSAHCRKNHEQEIKP